MAKLTAAQKKAAANKAAAPRLEGEMTCPVTKAVLFAKPLKLRGSGKFVKMIIHADTSEVDGVNDAGKFYLTPKQADRVFTSSGFPTFASLVSAINAAKGKGYSLLVSYNEVRIGDTYEVDGETRVQENEYVSTLVEELHIPLGTAQKIADQNMENGSDAAYLMGLVEAGLPIEVIGQIGAASRMQRSTSAPKPVAKVVEKSAADDYDELEVGGDQ